MLLEAAPRRGPPGLDVEIVTLHASKFGRPLYEQHGFQPTNEMMLRPEASAPDRTRA